MSQIIPKPFDPSQKIEKAAFEGAPSVVATEDLNRQIDSILYQLRTLGKSPLILSDFGMSITIDGTDANGIFSTLPGGLGGANVTAVDVTGTYAIINGARLSISYPTPFTPATLGLTSVIYAALYAKRTLIKSADDFSKAISGVKFADNTTVDGASHYVYSNEKVIVSVDSVPPTSGDLVLLGVLGKITFNRAYGKTYPAPQQNRMGVVAVKDYFTVSETSIGSIKDMIVSKPLMGFGTLSHNYRLPLPTDSLNDAIQVLCKFAKDIISPTTLTLDVTTGPPNSGTMTVKATFIGGVCYLECTYNIELTTGGSMVVEIPELPKMRSTGTLHTIIGLAGSAFFPNDTGATITNATTGIRITVEQVDSGAYMNVTSGRFSFSYPYVLTETY